MLFDSEKRINQISCENLGYSLKKYESVLFSWGGNWTDFKCA